MPLDWEGRTRLKAAANGKVAAQTEIEDAVVAAHKAGGSLEEIGLAAGMTHVSLSKMLHRLGVREREDSVQRYGYGRRPGHEV